jgi:hypothetical protein
LPNMLITSAKRSNWLVQTNESYSTLVSLRFMGKNL